jgi:gephyrin
MISVKEAIDIILANTPILDTEKVEFIHALNRVCAENVVACEPLPPFAASVKDGFALKLTKKQIQKIKGEIDEPINYLFDVIGVSNAGDELIDVDLKEGQCVKINTGAAVPLKANAVIQIEDTISLQKDENGQDTKIEIVGTSGCGGSSNSTSVDLQVGQDIRPIGFDIKIGEVVVREKTLIRAAQIGICATVGALFLKVYQQPIVGLVSTGNELKTPNETVLKSGQIRDSNKYLLQAALKELGIEKVFDAGIAKDDANSVLNVFKHAMKHSDVIISTGGVSMGDKVTLFYN